MTSIPGFRDWTEWCWSGVSQCPGDVSTPWTTALTPVSAAPDTDHVVAMICSNPSLSQLIIIKGVLLQLVLRGRRGGDLGRKH